MYFLAAPYVCNLNCDMMGLFATEKKSLVRFDTNFRTPFIIEDKWRNKKLSSGDDSSSYKGADKVKSKHYIKGLKIKKNNPLRNWNCCIHFPNSILVFQLSSIFISKPIHCLETYPFKQLNHKNMKEKSQEGSNSIA